MSGYRCVRAGVASSSTYHGSELVKELQFELDGFIHCTVDTILQV